MSRRKIVAAAALAAAAFGFSAPALAQAYLGFSAGQADVDESIAIPGLLNPGGRFDGEDTGFKFFGGYQFTPNFALEGALVDFGDVSYSGTFGGSAVTGGRIQNSGLNIAAVGIVPIGSVVSLFGKAGVLFWYSEASDVTGGIPFYSEADGTDLALGLGANFALGRNFMLRAEWERFDIANTDVDFVSLGFLYRF